MWDQGRLELTFEEVEYSQEEGWDVESLLVKSGVKKQIGNLGSKQFMLPGREVFIFYFRLDFANMVLSLYGSCSSIFNDSHPWKINLCLFPNDEKSASLRIETMLYSERERGVARIFCQCLSMWIQKLRSYTVFVSYAYS